MLTLANTRGKGRTHAKLSTLTLLFVTLIGRTANAGKRKTRDVPNNTLVLTPNFPRRVRQLASLLNYHWWLCLALIQFMDCHVI